jgi:hypothetical protein
MAVITRDEWGAGPQRAETIPLPVQRLYLHHSVTPEWLGAEAARNLQDIARARGFLDISYSWLVDVAGNRIEGRGWGRAGAHTVGWNSTSHAICLVGNFQDKVPPDAMLAGAAALVRKHARVGPDRITHGHRDVASTACPGDRAYTRIDDINQLAAQPPKPEPEPQEDPDMLEISTAARGDGQGIAVREALNDWLRAWNRVKDALAEPGSTWEFLPLPDTVDSAVVARVEYVCRNARAKSVPDSGLKGVSFAHLDLVAMDYARMVELANRIHDGSHHEMMATMQEQIDRLLAAEPEPTPEPM